MLHRAVGRRTCLVYVGDHIREVSAQDNVEAGWPLSGSNRALHGAHRGAALGQLPLPCRRARLHHGCRGAYRSNGGGGPGRIGGRKPGTAGSPRRCTGRRRACRHLHGWKWGGVFWRQGRFRRRGLTRGWGRCCSRRRGLGSLTLCRNRTADARSSGGSGGVRSCVFRRSTNFRHDGAERDASWETAHRRPPPGGARVGKSWVRVRDGSSGRASPARARAGIALPPGTARANVVRSPYRTAVHPGPHHTLRNGTAPSPSPT
mmetsp:Transcript_9108/g.16415  ORF Transcript_9108/g.16415 Transcript_9108/m.16415 type:complete len:261 (+) Transcript_9108:339-1121(+)